MGHVVSHYFKLHDLLVRKGHANQNKNQPSILTTSKSSNDNDSVLDTCTTNHITNDHSTLGNPIPYSGFDGIVLGNGDRLSIFTIASGWHERSCHVSNWIVNIVFHKNDINVIKSPSFSVYKSCELEKSYKLSFLVGKYVTTFFSFWPIIYRYLGTFSYCLF